MRLFCHSVQSVAAALTGAAVLWIGTTAQTPAPAQRQQMKAEAPAAAAAVKSLEKTNVIHDTSQFAPGIALSRAVYLKLLYGALAPSAVPKSLLRAQASPHPSPSSSPTSAGTPVPGATPHIRASPTAAWYNPLFVDAKRDQLLRTVPDFNVNSATQPVHREEVAVTAIQLALRQGAIHPGPVPASFPMPSDIDDVQEQNRDAVRLAIYFGCVPLRRDLRFDPKGWADSPTSVLCVTRLQKKPNKREVQ